MGTRKVERCGGQVVYETTDGRRVFIKFLGGPDLYSARCTVCGHRWQDAGRSRRCRALVNPPPPPPSPPLPGPPYGLTHDGVEYTLTASVDGCEVLVDFSELEKGGVNLSDLVVVTRDYLRDLEAVVGEFRDRASVGHGGAVWPPGRHPRLRGTARYPCEECGQTDKGNTLSRGWYHCNGCGYPGQ